MEQITEEFTVTLTVSHKHDDTEEILKTIFEVESMFKDTVVHQIATGQIYTMLKMSDAMALLKKTEWKNNKII